MSMDRNILATELNSRPELKLPHSFFSFLFLDVLSDSTNAIWR